MFCLVGVVGMLYRRRLRIRIIFFIMKFEFKFVFLGRYGNGFDIMYIDNGIVILKLFYKFIVVLRY